MIQNHVISFPKSGRTRLTLMCMLLLSRITGKPVKSRDLSQHVLFSHFGWMPTNVPKLTKIRGDDGGFVRGPLIPDSSRVTLLSRDPLMTLISLHRWYTLRGMLENNRRVPTSLHEFILSDYGAGELIRYRQLTHARIEHPAAEHNILRITFEETLTTSFIRNDLPWIVNRNDYVPSWYDIAFIVNGSKLDNLLVWCRHEPGEMPEEYRFIWEDIRGWDNQEMMQPASAVWSPDFIPPKLARKLRRKLWRSKWTTM